LIVPVFNESSSYWAKLTPGERFNPEHPLMLDPYSTRIWGFFAFKNGL
jgi:hypothetical protein